VTTPHRPVGADLTRVAVFAVSGASAAVVKRLDLFGVVPVGFGAALAVAVPVTWVRVVALRRRWSASLPTGPS
jgi:hypothetical protein